MKSLQIKIDGSTWKINDEYFHESCGAIGDNFELKADVYSALLEAHKQNKYNEID